MTKWSLSLLFLIAMPLAAQQARYKFAARDTMRYHELTETSTEVRPPRGPVKLTARHESTIALLANRGDTVTAWYEQLALMSVSPRGENKPETEGALRLPFRLVVTPRGQVSTAAAPAFSDEITGFSDLTRQFEDFFISLPANLKLGAQWADTIENTRSGDPQDSVRSRHVRRYRALRDTVVDGVAGILIDIQQDLNFRFKSPMKNQPVTIDTQLEGTEEGTAVFDPRAGRLLARARRGQLKGQQLFRGMGNEIAVPMTYEYTSTINRRF